MPHHYRHWSTLNSVTQTSPVSATPVPLESTASVDFDDITKAGYSTIANGYSGLNWKSAYVIHRQYYRRSGYNFGAMSGNYVAFFVGSSGSSKIGEISSATPFSVAGFQATAAWNRDLDVLIESFDSNGELLGSSSHTLGRPQNGATFIDLRDGKFQGVHKLRITSSGGYSSGLQGSGPYLCIDDFRVYDMDG